MFAEIFYTSSFIVGLGSAALACDMLWEPLAFLLKINLSLLFGGLFSIASVIVFCWAIDKAGRHIPPLNIKWDISVPDALIDLIKDLFRYFVELVEELRDEEENEFDEGFEDDLQ